MASTTVAQLEKLLEATDFRGRTFIWLGIGLGFGPKDLSAIRVGQIVNDAYDLRRGKTGIERFSETPPCVWIACVRAAVALAAAALLDDCRVGHHSLTHQQPALFDVFVTAANSVSPSPAREPVRGR